MDLVANVPPTLKIYLDGLLALTVVAAIWRGLQ